MECGALYCKRMFESRRTDIAYHQVGRLLGEYHAKRNEADTVFDVRSAGGRAREQMDASGV